MLALSDEALGRLAIGASRVAPHARARWLQRLARQLDPPPRPPTRQARWRAPASATGVRSTGLTGHLTEVEALDHVRVERALAARQREQRRAT
jgi:hypothetical protein